MTFYQTHMRYVFVHGIKDRSFPEELYLPPGSVTKGMIISGPDGSFWEVSNIEFHVSVDTRSSGKGTLLPMDYVCHYRVVLTMN